MHLTMKYTKMAKEPTHNMKNLGPVVLVKIGGSLISDKTKAYSVKDDALRQIAQEVKKISDNGVPMVLGHGAGSFAHVPAKKYQTHRGFINDSSAEGLVKVAAAARDFNQIVMAALHDAGVPAISIAPCSCMTAENFELGTMYAKPIELLLREGLVPVVFGDTVLDATRGCAIFSTELVLKYLAAQLIHDGWSISHIVHCSSAGGVFDGAGQLIPLLTPDNFAEYSAAVSGSDGTDVSGGMAQKVAQTLEMAESGIPGIIIDGIAQKLSDAVMGKKVKGTYVRAV